MSDFALRNPLIPAYMLAKLQAYVDRGEPLGGFLSAVISNDLKEAVFKADSASLLLLSHYVSLMYWDMPSASQGSKEKMEAWVARCGLLNLTEQRVLADAIDAGINHGSDT